MVTRTKIICELAEFIPDVTFWFGQTKSKGDKYSNRRNTVTYDHRLRRIGHPVRSAIHKPQIGRLVVGWVTTSEYLLLYVFDFFAQIFGWRMVGVAAPEEVACCANRNHGVGPLRKAISTAGF